MTDSGVPSEAKVNLPPAHVDDVFAATEQVRAADFPAVPADLLAAVLAAERDNPDSRPAAAKAVARAVETWLADHPSPAADSHSGGEA